jgi:hypothetical protein
MRRLEFGVSGLECQVHILRFRCQGSGFVRGFGLGQGSEPRVKGLGFLEFKVQVSGFTVWSSGCRVQGSGFGV